jgi:hypothetical protein
LTGGMVGRGRNVVGILMGGRVGCVVSSVTTSSSSASVVKVGTGLLVVVVDRPFIGGCVGLTGRKVGCGLGFIGGDVGIGLIVGSVSSNSISGCVVVVCMVGRGLNVGITGGRDGPPLTGGTVGGLFCGSSGFETGRGRNEGGNGPFGVTVRSVVINSDSGSSVTYIGLIVGLVCGTLGVCVSRIGYVSGRTVPSNDGTVNGLDVGRGLGFIVESSRSASVVGSFSSPEIPIGLGPIVGSMSSNSVTTSTPGVKGREVVLICGKGFGTSSSASSSSSI